MEVLDKGSVPLPDKMASKVSCSTSSLNVDIDGNTLVKTSSTLRHVLVTVLICTLLGLSICASPHAQ